MSTDYRFETDYHGSVRIPATAYWGPQTQRALDLFGRFNETLPASVIHTFGTQKRAAATANSRLGVLNASLAAQIIAVASDVEDGKLDDHFPLPVWQTGSGTQTNMNVNEVIANRANEIITGNIGLRHPIHPNDHVNCSQSSNDTFPTVMHIAVYSALEQVLKPALSELSSSLRNRAIAFNGIVKVARTHLMDAVPMMLSDSFHTFAQQIDNSLQRVCSSSPHLLPLSQGGTAAGTQLNAPHHFDIIFCEEVNAATNFLFIPAANKFEGMGAHDAIVELSGVLNVLAVSIMKIANDLRLMGSGPRCGFAEILLPEDGLTSSIMPGKRNAVIPEVLVQAAAQVIGNHTTITVAGAQGNFELNVTKPVILYNVLQSITIMGRLISALTKNFVLLIEPNHEKLARDVEMSILPVTALNPVLGYDSVARITQLAYDQGLRPRDAAVASGLVDVTTYDRFVQPGRMAESKLSRDT